MADSTVPITSGAGTNIDTRTESTNSQHRQVIVIGDPAINNNVAAVASQDVASSDQSTPAALVRLAGSATIVGLDGTTARPLRMNSDGALKIYDLAAGTVTANVAGSLTGITNSIAVHVLSTGGTILVKDASEPTVVIAGKRSTTTQHLIANTDGAIKVYDIVTGTINTVANITNITNSAAVHVLSTGGTIIVKNDPASYNLVNAFHTAGIFTVSGSTSGGTTSGVTLISPSSAYNFKIFAYSIQTTSVVSESWLFTNGAATQTELWRPLITANSSTSAPVGANLAVTPPGFLFATGTNTTLALKSSSGSLVHYSVSYIKETA